MKYNLDRYAAKQVSDPDHPCSNEPLEPVDAPESWERRGDRKRCYSRKETHLIPDVVPPDVGIVDVRPNVYRAGREEGCRTVFIAWSVYSHVDKCVVARVQDIWLLGARLHVDESEANKARAGELNKNGKLTRNKNVNAWFYGLYAPPGSIDPDPSSAMDVRYDPWSVVHPGFYETDSSNRNNSRLGRPVRDDRFTDGLQLAAVHVWIDPITRSPRTVSYRVLRGVDMRSMSSGRVARASGALSASSLVPIAAVSALLGAGAMHWSKRR